MTARRALGRVARRDIARHRGRSVLVVALVALPVAAMVAGIALYRTTAPSPERSTTAEMGRADLLAFAGPRDDVQSKVPEGSRLEPIVFVDDDLLLPGT